MTATLDFDQILRLAKDEVTGEIYRVHPDFDGKYTNAAVAPQQFHQQVMTQATSTIIVLDYSLYRPSDGELRNAGTDVVCRYLSAVNALTTKKIIWKTEYDHLIFDLMIGVHLNYEWYTSRCTEGYASGKTDGQIALKQAKDLGHPKGYPITFSDDQSTTPLQALDAYLHGCADGLGGYYRVGNYAPRAKMDAMLINGRAEFGWQPTAWAGLDANGRPIISNRAHLFQHFGGAPIQQTDISTVLREPPFPWYNGGKMAAVDITPAAQEMIWDELINNYVKKPVQDPNDPTKKIPDTSQARSFVSDIHKRVYTMQVAQGNQATSADMQAQTEAIAANTQAVKDLADKLGPLTGHFDVTGTLDLSQPPATPTP